MMRCVAVFVGINHASAVSFSGCAVQSSFLRYTVKVSLLLMSIYHIMSQLNHLLPSMLFQSTLLSLLSAVLITVLGVLSVHFRKQLTPGTQWTSSFSPFSGSICWILRVHLVNSLYIATLHPSTVKTWFLWPSEKWREHHSSWRILPEGGGEACLLLCPSLA